MSKKEDKIKLNNSTKSIKKFMPFISGLSFISVSSLLVVTSIGLSTQSTTGNFGANGNLLFDNKIFKNRDELMEYAQKSYFQRTESTDNRISWSIDERGEKVYFNDPKLLREHLLSNIKQTSALSSKNFNTNSGGLGEVNANDFSNLYFNKTQDELKTNIYRGKNNSIHKSVDSAKDSYLSIHDAYYFNNVYFRNIEELKLYLQTVYYVPGGPGESETKPKNIGIVGPNGISSSPINSIDLFYEAIGASDNQKQKTLQAKKDFINNVGSQARRYVQIKDMNDEFFYFSEDDMKNPTDLLLKFNNPSYTTLHTNQGVSSYVVDLDQSDQNTLFGPYYAKTTGDFDKMKDHKMWQVTDRNDPLISDERNSSLISGLLNLILFEDDTLKENQSDKMPLNIKHLNEKYILPFYETLKTENNAVYKKWLDFSTIIKSGKRYNTFNALPIFFIFLIENLIEDEATEYVINQTKLLFTEIAKYLDKSVAVLFPRDLKELLKIDDKNGKYGDYLSFVEIFDFNNNDLDLSVNLEYFINEISTNFSQFIVAINIISQASLNAMYNGGLLPYKQEHIKNVINSTDKVKVKDENSASYEKLFNVFSSSTVDEFKAHYLVSETKTVIGNDALLDDLVISISMTNSLFSQSDKFIFSQGKSKITYTPPNSHGNTTIPGFISDDEYKIFEGIKNDVAKKIVEAKEILTWENFILIKFINKVSPSKLSTVKFNIDQSTLFNNLETLIKNNINGKEYSMNFIINPKVTESMLNLFNDKSVDFINGSQGFLALIEKVNSSLSKIKKEQVIDMAKGVLELFKNHKALDLEAIKKIQDGLKTVGKLSTIAKAIPYAQIALIAVDLFIDGFIPKNKYNSYIYGSGANKYIWNGGQSTTMFFGLAEISSTTSKDMKLLDPQKVSNARMMNEYYFNGKRYSTRSDNQLKIDQLRAIINNEFQTENATIVYSFDEIPKNNLTSPSTKVFKEFGGIDNLVKAAEGATVETLVQYVYNSIYRSLNAVTKLYHVDKFIFANGHVQSKPGDVLDELINEVISEIQPVKIALLPSIINNKPKYSNVGNTEDGSLAEYTLPSKSWNYTGYSTNLTDNKYIIFDPNQLDEITTDSEAMSNVRTLFHSSFDIDSKVVIENELKTNNAFNEMSSSILNKIVYEVKLENNQIKYFFDQMSAFNWLISQRNFTLYSYNTMSDIYKYEGKVFYSREEFMNFVLNSAIMESE